MVSVLQDWVMELTLMQQAVVISAIRGPDNMAKEHPTKAMTRWFRRCVLLSAFDKKPLLDPHAPGGGSFTGPLPEGTDLNDALKRYLDFQDEVPLHFYTHFMQAAQILGYKHSDDFCRDWWGMAYLKMVNYLHLRPESEADMDMRLGDIEKNWKAAEERMLESVHS